MKKCTECNYHADCFANRDGLCTALEHTRFKRKDCPFFKTRIQHLESSIAAMETMLPINTWDKTCRVERYYVTADAFERNLEAKKAELAILRGAAVKMEVYYG